MKYAEQRAAVETKFMSGWDSNTTPVKFDNVVGLLKGTGIVQDETKLNEWCIVRVENQVARKGAINIKMVRHTGTVLITVFTKAGTGTKRARELADKVAEVMAPADGDVIVYDPAEVMAMGPTQDTSFYQVSMQVPYTVDQYL